MKEFHPPHIYQDNTLYFITAKTVHQIRFFDNNEKKGIILDCLKKSVQKFCFKLIAWVLIDNHYHIIVKVKQGKNVGFFINNLHSNSSRILNKIENKPGRQIWYQYWDRCIRSEKDFYIRLNYIHYNPVKHKIVSEMKEYFYSSYNEYLKNYGIDWVNDCFEKYPIIDYTLEE